MTNFIDNQYVEIDGGFSVKKGWEKINSEIKTSSDKIDKPVKIIGVEY